MEKHELAALMERDKHGKPFWLRRLEQEKAARARRSCSGGASQKRRSGRCSGTTRGTSPPQRTCI